MTMTSCGPTPAESRDWTASNRAHLGAPRIAKGEYKPLPLCPVRPMTSAAESQRLSKVAAAVASAAAENDNGSTDDGVAAGESSEKGLNNVGEVSSGSWVEVTVDSGAAESCMPTQWCTDYPADLSDPRLGAQYATASGEALTNEGQRALHMFTSEGSEKGNDLSIDGRG